MATMEDDVPIEADGDGIGFRIGGVRYVRPVQIGQSFATATDVDPND